MFGKGWLTVSSSFFILISGNVLGDHGQWLDATDSDAYKEKVLKRALSGGGDTYFHERDMELQCYVSRRCLVVGIQGGGEVTQTLPYAKEFVWTFCSHKWQEYKSFSRKHLHPGISEHPRVTMVELSQHR